MTIKYHRWLVHYLGWIVLVSAWLLYVNILFRSNLRDFVTLAASLMVSASVFSGLAFGLSSVIQSSEDKETASNAGEKFFFATICFALSALAGTGALTIDGFQPAGGPNWIGVGVFFKDVVVGFLRLLSLAYVSASAAALYHGHEWITELLLQRWGRRIGETTNAPTEAEQGEGDSRPAVPGHREERPDYASRPASKPNLERSGIQV